MRSASPSGGSQLVAMPGLVWRRTREGVPAGALWTSLIVFLLVLTIAKSTVAASWVPGVLDALPIGGRAGAVPMGVRAVTPLPWWLSMVVGLLAGPLVAVWVALPVLRADSLLLPGAASQNLFQLWSARVLDGTAFGDRAFVLVLITWLMWVTGAWLSWCVLRWRQPMIGLVPGAAALATNVLNFPADQNGYTLSFIVLTFALLLWSNYTTSVERANRAHVKLTGDARWDFWETGVVAVAGLVLLAIFLPPLSTEDRTVSMESSIFSSWAQLQEQLNHAGPGGTGTGTGGGTTGFSFSAGLGKPLKVTKNIVFTYSVSQTYAGPKYFRGVNLTETGGGVWFYPNGGAASSQQLLRNHAVPLIESYKGMSLAVFKIDIVNPAHGAPD